MREVLNEKLGARRFVPRCFIVFYSVVLCSIEKLLGVQKRTEERKKTKLSHFSEQ